MGFTNLSYAKLEKVANRLIVFRQDEMFEKADELNGMFADGWLVEERFFVDDRVVFLMKMEKEGRKVIHIDVGDMPVDEVSKYIERMKAVLLENDGDYFVPNR